MVIGQILRIGFHCWVVKLIRGKLYETVFFTFPYQLKHDNALSSLWMNPFYAHFSLPRLGRFVQNAHLLSECEFQKYRDRLQMFGLSWANGFCDTV